MSCTTRSFPVFVLAVLVVLEVSQAFLLPIATQQHCPRRQGLSGYNSPSREPNSVVLSAQKKRRRRRKESKETSSPPPPSEAGEGVGGIESSDEPQPGSGGGDELPEFDLDVEEFAPGEAAATTAPPKRKINPDEITANMMGSGNANTARTVDELISDRTLENRFEFDEKGDPSIPDFVDLARASSTPQSYDSSASDSLATAGIGKKKQRRAERVANAIAAKEAEESEKSFLSNIPQFLNEKGEVSPIKILEQGAWIGIFLLIGWEVYINSPFFERAAPMAPIVYEILM